MIFTERFKTVVLLTLLICLTLISMIVINNALGGGL